MYFLKKKKNNTVRKGLKYLGLFLILATATQGGLLLQQLTHGKPYQRGENPGYFLQWFEEKKDANGEIPSWLQASWHKADLRNLSLRSGEDLIDTVYELGPQQTGGRTRAILVDRRNDNIILAAGVSGGVWRSEDGGSSWKALNDQQSSMIVSCLVQNPLNPDVMYFGTGEAREAGVDVPGDGIFKSIDGGRSFQQLSSTRGLSGMDEVWTLEHSLTDTNTLFAGTEKALYRSTDAGKTWEVVYNNARVSDIICFPDGRVLFTRISTGIYISDSAGKVGTFKMVSDADIPAQGAYARIEVDYCKRFPKVIYALFEGPTYSSNATAFMKSSDGGRTWIRRAAPTSIGSGYQTYCVMLGCSPTDSNRVVTGGVNMAISTNGGSSWANSPTGHSDHHVVAKMNVNQDFYLVGSDGGVWKHRWSATTANPADLNRGYRTTQFYAGGYGISGDKVIGGTQDNGTHFTKGNLQSAKVYGADGAYAHIGLQDGTVAYGSTQNDGIFRLDNFEQAGQFAVGISSDSFTIEGVDFINAYQINKADQYQLFYRTNAGLHFTQDGGDSWRKMTKRLVNLKAIGVSNEKNPTVYFGGASASFYRADSILTKGFYREVNLSNSVPTSVTNDMLKCIIVHPRDKYTVYVAFNNINAQPRVWRVRKVNTSTPVWENVSGNLPASLPVNFVQCDPYKPDSVLYAATDFGLYYTTNGGATWTKETRVPNVFIPEIKLREDGTLFIITHGRGVFAAKVKMDPTVSVKNMNALPALRYGPNPAHELLRIETGTGNCQISAFNLNGQELYRERSKGGTHQINTSSWRNGYYLIRVQTDEGSRTFKALVAHP
ncbi:MAG: T9SS type A sorting domain-containing protein [Bacteroidetes bacterium]|nr:T9SS type A sorting domain-containing protein [Bacteroidota bacterium]